MVKASPTVAWKVPVAAMCTNPISVTEPLVLPSMYVPAI